MKWVVVGSETGTTKGTARETAYGRISGTILESQNRRAPCVLKHLDGPACHRQEKTRDRLRSHVIDANNWDTRTTSTRLNDQLTSRNAMPNVNYIFGPSSSDTSDSLDLFFVSSLRDPRVPFDRWRSIHRSEVTVRLSAQVVRKVYENRLVAARY